MIKLLDIRQNDGSRNFFDLPTSVTWDDLIGHLNQLEQLTIEKFLPSPVLGSWLVFSFNGYKFSVNDQMGKYWFFVENTSCPEEILFQLAEHLLVFTVTGKDAGKQNPH
jgi:hypothetical protein